MAVRKKQTSRGRANRVVGELRSEGFPGNGNKFQNGAEDQVVLRELRSGGDLDVPVSAKARGHIAMHKPTQARSHFARNPLAILGCWTPDSATWEPMPPPFIVASIETAHFAPRSVPGFHPRRDNGVWTMQ